MYEQMNLQSQNIKTEMGAWVTKHTQICKVGDDTLEIATTEKDSLGETVYCFIQEHNDKYRVGDDSRTLFKLDPGASDEEIYEMAEEIAVAAGFEFDRSNGEIWKQTNKEKLVDTIMKLTQLLVAISYLE